MDLAVNLCGVMQNLREAIFKYQQRAEEARTKSDARLLVKRGIDYLERYLVLIIFNAYLQDNVDKLKFALENRVSVLLPAVVGCAQFEL